MERSKQTIIEQTAARDGGGTISLIHRTAGMAIGGAIVGESWGAIYRAPDGVTTAGQWFGSGYAAMESARAEYQRRVESDCERHRQAVAVEPEILRSRIESYRETLANVERYGRKGKRGTLIGKDRKRADALRESIRLNEERLPAADEAAAALND